jgi:hypothetical protein
MAHRELNTTKVLEVSVMFEPSRVSPACVAQAYEQVVPSPQRTPSPSVPIRQGAHGRQRRCVGRGSAS